MCFRFGAGRGPARRRPAAARVSLLLLAAATACGDGGGTGPVPVERSVVLAPVAAAGVSGVATIVPESGATSTITVALRGGSAESRYVGAVRAGTCDAPGPAVAALRRAYRHEGGTAATAVTTGVPNALLGPGYHVRYDAEGDRGAWPPAACGDIATVPPATGGTTPAPMYP